MAFSRFLLRNSFWFSVLLRADYHASDLPFHDKNKSFIINRLLKTDESLNSGTMSS